MRRPRPSSIRSLGCSFAFLLAAASAGVAGAQDKEYRIRLHRPEKVGDVWSLKAKGSTRRSLSVTVGGREAKKEDEAAEIELDGEVKVLQVDEGGRATRLSCTVDRCVLDGKEMYPKGAVITAESQGGKTQFTVGGEKPDEKATGALTTVLQAHDPEERADEDQEFGTDEPKKVGDTWPVNAERVARELARRGLPVEKDAVKGTGKLVAVKQVGGREALEVEVELTVDFAGKQFNGLKADKGSLAARVSGVFPADENLRAPGQATSLRIRIHAAGEGPDGQPVVLDLSGVEKGEKTFEDVKKQ